MVNTVVKFLLRRNSLFIYLSKSTTENRVLYSQRETGLEVKKERKIMVECVSEIGNNFDLIGRLLEKYLSYR